MKRKYTLSNPTLLSKDEAQVIKDAVRLYKVEGLCYTREHAPSIRTAPALLEFEEPFSPYEYQFIRDWLLCCSGAHHVSERWLHAIMALCKLEHSNNLWMLSDRWASRVYFFNGVDVLEIKVL